MKIPKGWRRIPNGVEVKVGDKLAIANEPWRDCVWTVGATAGVGDIRFIRKIEPRHYTKRDPIYWRNKRIVKATGLTIPQLIKKYGNNR